ncbi:MAG: hypothetical protein Q8P77_01965 [Candidatus Veblenbacteria bacterium]|nr:hypothetical protein [Candidatus Veblenbacteria bacterium]
MSNYKLIGRTLLHALGVLAYTAFAVTIISSGETLFGDGPAVWGGVAFLMLFVLSATVVGLLVLGKPVALFITGERKEAVTFLAATVAWLAILTAAMLAIRLAMA